MRLPRLLPLLVLASLVIPANVHAQRGRGGGGEPPKNLQVLPKDMPRQQLTALMRSTSMALGVRCDHCHVPAPGGTQLDYALDDKETKKVAREMIKMVMDINQKYLPTTGREVSAANRVTCETCHHGLAKPQTLRAALGGAVAAKGADSAVALYRSLRERYYGSAAYDFSEPSLNEAGNEVARMPNQNAAAITLLKLNLEYFPRSVPTLQSLAGVSLAGGDTTAAVEALRKALEIQPDNQQLRNMLERIRPGGAR